MRSGITPFLPQTLNIMFCAYGKSVFSHIITIARHLKELREKYECENFQCVFLAPSIFVDSENQIDWVKDKKQLVIRPYKIVDFINYLDTAASLYQIV